MSQFKLPDVGEGLTEAEIVSWKVQVGDTVKVNDTIVEIETAKSLVELPSPFAGTVSSLLVEEGTTVEVGAPIIDIQTGDSDDRPAGTEEPSSKEEPESEKSEEQPEREAILVGYGPKKAAPKRRTRKNHAADVQVSDEQPSTDTRPLAKPPVRKLAKDLGVDLSTVAATGPGGIITRDDVRAASSGTQAPVPGKRATVVSDQGWQGLPREERIPIRSVRKATARAVTTSAFTAPHVTEFLSVDVSRTMELVERLRESREFKDIRLSPLAVLARAMCVAVRHTPEVNARWDEDSGEIVMQRFVNLGIAAATSRGLVVPNVKDADQLTLPELAVAINELVTKAREGKASPEDMTGGTISITNIGVFGADTGTPILLPGESAIVAFGTIKQRPWVHEGQVQPRWVTTLALSFDHRLVDGEQSSQFLTKVGALLEEPANALVWA